MTLTKKRMVREIGRRTRLRNRDVQLMLETLIDIWIESLVVDERIELENFFILQTQQIDRNKLDSVLSEKPTSRHIRRVLLRASKRLKRSLNHS